MPPATTDRELHDAAVAVKPHSPLRLGNFWVAVLYHDRTETEEYQNEDFLWIKVHPRITFRTIHETYRKGKLGNFRLEIDGAIPEATTVIEDLKKYDDKLIVFQAIASTPALLPKSPDESMALIPPVLGEEQNPELRSASPESQNETFPISSPQGSSEVSSLPGGTTDSEEAEEEDSSSNPSDIAEDVIYTSHFMNETSPDVLEAGADEAAELVNQLMDRFSQSAESCSDLENWTRDLKIIQALPTRARAVIGVVGSTGAGKSSLINAVLDEEQLVPTDCMRACTAVVTEVSWNHMTDPQYRYRAEVDFISAEEWKNDLHILFQDILEADGKVIDEMARPDTDSAVAFAKIRAVYPQYRKADFGGLQLDELVNQASDSFSLGSTIELHSPSAQGLYKSLQNYIDSQDCPTDDSRLSREARALLKPVVWPLIKVVRIYTKAAALSTGAILVDLPGVQDSNAARAAVAENYIKDCCGLWVVAPMNRAVSDKAAKALLGQTFKRQLQFDGKISLVTFICTKTDEISITEMTQTTTISDRLVEVNAHEEKLNQDKWDAAERIHILRNEYRTSLRPQNVDPKQVSIPTGLEATSMTGSERDMCGKRGLGTPELPSQKKVKTEDGSTEFSVNVTPRQDGGAEDVKLPESEMSCSGEHGDRPVRDLAEDERSAAERREDLRLAIVADIKALRANIKAINQRIRQNCETRRSICIMARNELSQNRIRQDFAEGIRELDDEFAAESDEEEYDPDECRRDYQQIAQSLPVFCVSSRAYQIMMGRLGKEDHRARAGFGDIESAQIPQLRKFCQKATFEKRLATSRHFLNQVSQILGSLNLWASDNNIGFKLNDEQIEKAQQDIESQLSVLQRNLTKAAKDCTNGIEESISRAIYSRRGRATEIGRKSAAGIAEQWNLKGSQGGLHFTTFRAVCRRGGVYSSPAKGVVNYNQDLVEPVVNFLAAPWERAFSTQIPSIIRKYPCKAIESLRQFHESINKWSEKTGIGRDSIALLSQQQSTFDQSFRQISRNMAAVITAMQRDAHRQLTPSVTRSMAPSFEMAVGEQRGKGAFVRMKKVLNVFVIAAGKQMFRGAFDDVKEGLDGLIRQSTSTLEAESARLFETISRNYTEAMAVIRTTTERDASAEDLQVRQDTLKIMRLNHRLGKLLCHKVSESLDREVATQSAEIGTSSSDQAPDSRLAAAPNVSVKCEPHFKDLAINPSPTAHGNYPHGSEPSNQAEIPTAAVLPSVGLPSPRSLQARAMESWMDDDDDEELE